MQPGLQLKCTHDLTHSKSILTRQCADMNAMHGSDEREGARKTQGRQNVPMTAPSNFTIRNNVFILCLSQGLNCQQLCHHTLSPLAHFCIQHITRHNNSFFPVLLPVKPSCTLRRDFLPHNWGLNSQVIQWCRLMHTSFDISRLC